jgi:hypothetical protein
MQMNCAQSLSHYHAKFADCLVDAVGLDQALAYARKNMLVDIYPYMCELKATANPPRQSNHIHSATPLLSCGERRRLGLFQG